MTTETHTQSESRPVSPSVGRAERLSRCSIVRFFVKVDIVDIVDDDRDLAVVQRHLKDSPTKLRAEQYATKESSPQRMAA
jgi:hypothetical protein